MWKKFKAWLIGREHDWSRWTPFEKKSTGFMVMTGETTFFQRRHCIRCGFTERRLVDSDENFDCTSSLRTQLSTDEHDETTIN